MQLYRNLLRANEVTASQYCRSPEEMSYLAVTYLTYVRAQDQYRTLYERHYGKGEKTVHEAAKIVGLKLPQTPEVANNQNTAE